MKKFEYVTVLQTVVLDALGSYTTFGIQGICVDYARNEAREDVIFVSDISVNQEFVQSLALQCTQLQLHPCHLTDVVLDAIS